VALGVNAICDGAYEAVGVEGKSRLLAFERLRAEVAGLVERG
jgi:hypothetical protein